MITNCFKLLIFFISYQIITCIYSGFDDTILFRLNWPGDSQNNNLLFSNGEESMKVVSANDEKYECWLPNIEKKTVEDLSEYDGPTPVELLKPLFLTGMCSYRLESYWTYEVCHGKYIRQYHEEREGKKNKLQEYYLGQWTKVERDKEIERLIKLHQNLDKNFKFKTKKIDGAQLPYFEINLQDGTVCDLNNKPRSTKVLYVCHKQGKQDIYSLKEISTCEYEVIVLTPLLCSHPKFRPVESGEYSINCIPVDNSPKKPKSLLALDAHSLKLRETFKKFDGETLSVEIRQIDANSEDSERLLENLKGKISGILDKPPKDLTPVENFLSGRNCLNGGTGWWKYEFCYGKYVEQYHIDKDGTKTSLNLGKFNVENHINWLKRNPHKTPQALMHRKQLSHFYSNGAICDKTGKPRQTEVKLKCLPSSGSAVQLFLIEPKFCEYILGVESPLICDILNKVDENGLITMPIDKYNKKDTSPVPLPSAADLNE